MKSFNIEIFFILICINNIISLLLNHNSLNEICPEGKYGPNCTKDCNCNNWSTSNHCSKIEGRCLDCKFGHFGSNCDSRCYPTCKTNLCCSIKSENFKESNKKLKIKNNLINIQIENITLRIFVDYNIGYPLAIFNKTINYTFVNGSEEIFEYKYSLYDIKGKKYDNYLIKFLDQEDFDIALPLSFILDEKNYDQNINGIIGLGFYNSINEKLFENKNIITENIASFKKNEDDNKEINVLFGDLFDEEKKYVHKLSFCKSEDENNNTELFNNNKCKINAFGPKSYSNVLKLNDTFIQFSLDINSQFILPKNDAYINYIIKYYFKNENYIKKEINKTNYLCYKTNNINRLSEFGFVINHFFYFFSANNFFYESKEICGEDYSIFLIQFNDNNTGIIFGKNFYNETQFTLDNEEKKIYFYSKYVEYFSGEIKPVINEDLNNILNPLSWSFIVVGISLFLNIISFLVYFYFKRKKENKKFKIN